MLFPENKYYSAGISLFPIGLSCQVEEKNSGVEVFYNSLGLIWNSCGINIYRKFSLRRLFFYAGGHAGMVAIPVSGVWMIETGIVGDVGVLFRIKNPVIGADIQRIFLVYEFYPEKEYLGIAAYWQIRCFIGWRM